MTDPRHPGNGPQPPAQPDEDLPSVHRSPATAGLPAEPAAGVEVAGVEAAAEPATGVDRPAEAVAGADGLGEPVAGADGLGEPVAGADGLGEPVAGAAGPAQSAVGVDGPAEPAVTDGTTAKPLSPALDKTFKIGLVLKGLDGVLEVVGGILLLFLSPQAIEHLVRALTAHELSEDPHDAIARYLLHTAAHLNHGTTLFGAIYLLSHGAAKIVLVALVLRNKLWAYPWLIGLLLAFIIYQLYRITVVHFSAGLTALTIFDAFLVWLTWREYRAKRAGAHQARAEAAAPSPGGQRPARPQAG